MDERLVSLLKGINHALTEFLVTVDKVVVSPSDSQGRDLTPDTKVLLDSHDEEDSKDGDVGISKGPEPIVDPVPIQAPFEPDVMPDPGPEPTYVPETMEDPDPLTNELPSPNKFPLNVDQIKMAKRKDLRDLISSYKVSIVGPNGEGPEEMLVQPLRDALIKHVESAQAPVTTTALVEVDEPVVETPDANDDITGETSPAPMSKSALLFESWVHEQAGGITPGGTDVTLERAAELANFFQEHLPHVTGPERDPLESYFKNMGCSANCTSCPNGGMQPMFCYGVFDEEVTHISLNDAVNNGQFFKVEELEGQMAYAHTPT